MRILVIPGKGRTARELGQFCFEAFQTLGVEARILLFNPQGGKFTQTLFRKVTEERIVWEFSRFRPHVMLAVKLEEIKAPFLGKVKKKFNVTLANWWIDDPAHLHRSTKLSPDYDYFFTCDPESVSVHKQVRCPHVPVLTFGCDPSLHRTVSLSGEERSYYGSDVAFVGSMSSQRADVLRKIASFNMKIWSKREFANFDGERIICRGVPPTDPLYPHFTGVGVWGEEMVKVYNASKIVLNLHSQGLQTTNMRTFEVMGCGAFLLSDFQPSLSNFFKIGEELVCFEEPEQLQSLIAHYLQADEERRKIAQMGQENVHRNHTYLHRMKEVLNVIDGK